MEIIELCKSNVPTGITSDSQSEDEIVGLGRGCDVDRSKVFCWSRILDTAASSLSDRVRMLDGARFGGMSIQMGFRYCVRMKKTEVEDGRVQVSREDEEEWSRRQRG
ncbi:hypothetical protein AAG906_004712 [Vitis piasezkii]